MKKMFNELENILYKMIECQNMPGRLPSESYRMELVAFAKGYQTIEYNPGRQCGKSMMIAKNVETDDLVITRSQHTKETMIQRISVFNVEHIEVLTINEINDSLVRYKTIWVDDASILSTDVIEKIYELYAGSASRFIFLG